MRFTVELTLNSTKDSILLAPGYQSSLVSLLKSALEAVNPEYFKDLYENGNPMKLYTFGVYFPSAKFTHEGVELEGENAKLIWNFSCIEPRMAMAFYNGILSIKQGINQHPRRLIGSTLITDVKIHQINLPTITSNTITIRTLSPIVSRDHQDKDKDWFYSYKDPEFIQILKRTMMAKYESFFGRLTPAIINNFEITPIQPKKNVVKSYEKWVECSAGVYVLKGQSELLELIRDGGLGSRTGLGFGMVEVI